MDICITTLRGENSPGPTSILKSVAVIENIEKDFFYVECVMHWRRLLEHLQRAASNPMIDRVRTYILLNLLMLVSGLPRPQSRFHLAEPNFTFSHPLARCSRGSKTATITHTPKRTSSSGNSSQRDTARCESCGHSHRHQEAIEHEKHG